MTGDYTLITQDVARELLARDGPRRAVRMTTLVPQYQYDIENGRWKPEMAQPICLDPIGRYVTNGVHRLTALTRCSPGTTLRSIVTTATFDEIEDSNRSISDILTAQGLHGLTLSPTYAAGRRWMGLSASAGAHRSPMIQAGWVASRKDLIDLVPNIHTAANSLRGNPFVATLPTGAIGAIYDISLFGDGPETVDEFVDEVKSGPASSDSVIARLAQIDIGRRAKSVKGHMSGHRYALVVARAYTAWVEGESLSVLRGNTRSPRNINGYEEWSENWKEVMST